MLITMRMNGENAFLYIKENMYALSADTFTMDLQWNFLEADVEFDLLPFLGFLLKNRIPLLTHRRARQRQMRQAMRKTTISIAHTTMNPPHNRSGSPKPALSPIMSDTAMPIGGKPQREAGHQSKQERYIRPACI